MLKRKSKYINFIDIIVGGEDVKAAKPSPEGLLFAIKQLHVTKAETLYIGDSTVDAQTAKSADVDFVGVLHGMTTAEELQQYPHKKIMNSLEELLEKEPLTEQRTQVKNSKPNQNLKKVILILTFISIFLAIIAIYIFKPFL